MVRYILVKRIYLKKAILLLIKGNKISFQQLLTMFYIVKGLRNKLPIYQEVEKVSGNVL